MSEERGAYRDYSRHRIYRSVFPWGSRSDVVYLGWPIAPSYMSPNAEGGGELRGLSQWVPLYTVAQINFGDLTYLTYGLFLGRNWVPPPPTPHPLPACECVSPLGTNGGRSNTGGEGVGDPIRTTGKKAWQSVKRGTQQNSSWFHHYVQRQKVPCILTFSPIEVDRKYCRATSRFSQRQQ